MPPITLWKMALDGISRNDYEKLMRYTLPNDYFENVSRNRGRGQNNAWGPDYCFPDGLSSTKYTNSKLFIVKSQRLWIQNSDCWFVFDIRLRQDQELATGVGNKSRDFRDMDWDLGFIFKIWDLEFWIQFQNLGYGIGINFQNLGFVFKILDLDFLRFGIELIRQAHHFLAFKHIPSFYCNTQAPLTNF